MNSFQSINLTVNFIKEGKQVIAYAPALDISTVGKSEEHAKQRFHEIVQMFLKDIAERNVVDQVLTELGWTKTTADNNRAKWAPPSVKSVDLPIAIPA